MWNLVRGVQRRGKPNGIPGTLKLLPSNLFNNNNNKNTKVDSEENTTIIDVLFYFWYSMQSSFIMESQAILKM